MMHLNGDPAIVAVERAIAELRAGRAICVRAAAGCALVAGVETTRADLFERLHAFAPAGLRMAITGHRATTLGFEFNPGEAISLQLPPGSEMHLCGVLAGLVPHSNVDRALYDRLRPEACDEVTAAALMLAKQAQLLPAVFSVPSIEELSGSHVLTVTADQVHRSTQRLARDLIKISDARLPLAQNENCRLVLFRDSRNGAEHVAVIIGNIDPASAVPVRLHSSCLTGDLLGSLRCDCGDQLRGAVDQLGAAGGGVLLYLAQEGRGIGLANKLRAYNLQDSGLDTIDADHHLGFGADDRSYEVAASMLSQLDVSRIQLLTNNPHKIRALQEAGIELVAQKSLNGRVNRHNANYLRVKRERAGHFTPDALADLATPKRACGSAE
jgi:GTP cyclohydrolase II